MYNALERAWVSFQDSARFRRFARNQVGSALFRSRTYRKVQLGKHYLSSYAAYLQNPETFADVKTFCLFIGHNKSGTSMIGALLDAHADIILSDEVRAIDYVSAGFRREQIYHLLLRGSRRELMKGRVTARRLTPYAYLVPDQWQGRYRKLQVVGDGAAGTTTQKFGRDPDLLSRLQQTMGEVQVKFIQVIRNPYDPISVMMVRGKRSFDNAIEHYFANCEVLRQLRRQLDENQLLAVRYEDFVRKPEQYLPAICRFLGVEADAAYLEACISILYDKPDQRRHMVTWNASQIETVRAKIEQYDFLEGYSFEQ